MTGFLLSLASAIVVVVGLPLVVAGITALFLWVAGVR